MSATWKHNTGGELVHTNGRRSAIIDQNVYTFIVHPDASKPEIRDAVQSIFGVAVEKVNTVNRKGKRKRNRRTFTYGSRPDTKRAIVTLAEGETIDLFQD